MGAERPPMRRSITAAGRPAGATLPNPRGTPTDTSWTGLNWRIAIASLAVAGGAIGCRGPGERPPAPLPAAAPAAAPAADQPAAATLGDPQRCAGWIDGDRLTADVRVLREAFETLHPGLLRYATKPEMDRRFDALAERLGQGATLEEAYLALSEFAATIRCGHTWTSFYNQGKRVSAAILEGEPAGRGRVPFLFRWLDGRMVVTCSAAPETDLRRGDVITAINGEPTSAILARLLRIARADGGNDAKRVRQLEVHEEDRWEAFDVFLQLYYPHWFAGSTGAEARTDRPSTLRLTLADPAGEREIDVPSSRSRSAERASLQPRRRRRPRPSRASR